MLEAMGRTPFAPAKLLARPFTTAEAREVGLERWHLRGQRWQKLGPRTYAPAELDSSPALRLNAASLRLPAVAAFSGRTAAWLHGMDVEPCDPIEATVPSGTGVWSRSGLAIRRAALSDGDVVMARHWRATSVNRTLADLSSRVDLTEAVVLIDMALHGRLADLTGLGVYATSRSGRGVRNFRLAVRHAEPRAESPMESRLRMLLVLSGLPRPQAQVSLNDRHGRFLGRPDLYYPEQRLAIEYDGGTHRDRLAEDNRRQNCLLSDGIRLLRFTAGDILRTPDAVVAQVANMLRVGRRI